MKNLHKRSNGIYEKNILDGFECEFLRAVQRTLECNIFFCGYTNIVVRKKYRPVESDFSGGINIQSVKLNGIRGYVHPGGGCCHVVMQYSPFAGILLSIALFTAFLRDDVA